MVGAWLVWVVTLTCSESEAYIAQAESLRMATSQDIKSLSLEMNLLRRALVMMYRVDFAVPNCPDM